MRRVLVTGGAGFLGSHLCERLLAGSCEVVCLDNFFTGRRGNIEHLQTNPRFELLRHDINDPLHVEVDDIYHLACPASPIHYQRNPVRTIRTCVQGTLTILDLARDTGARVVLASTSEIYGDPEEHPQSETYWGHVNPIGPRACYDEGKRCAEALAVSWKRQYQTDVRIARIFNTYGPRMHEDDGRVISNFIVQAIRHQPITLHGDGLQTRSFCYASDLVDGLVRLMRAPAVDEPLNLGNPEERSIRSIAELVCRLVGAPFEIAEHPLPKDDPVRRRPDISRAVRLLEWAPVVGLEEGLRRTIVDFEARLGSGFSVTP